MIRIVVDSTADLPPALCEQYGITVVPVLVQFGRQSFRDNVDLTRNEFYARLVESEQLPTTAAPSVGMFEEVFRALAADGSDILSLSVAGALSGTLSAARQAAQQIADARIVCIDSQTLAMPITYLAVAAAQAANEGRSLDTVAALVETLRSRTVLLVALQTLRYLEKGGRIGPVRAFLGSMLNVKPIFEVRDSQVLPIEQVRSWRRAPQRMVELAQARGRFAELSVLYTTNQEDAEHLAALCADAGLLARERIHVGQVGGVLGAHTGPGALGLTGLLV